MSSASPAGNLTPTRAPIQPNVANVVLGHLHIKPWYPSFHPEDMIGGKRAEWLYVCQWCFKYTSEIVKFSAHCKVCPLKDDAPPGKLIYEDADYAIHQFDGEDHKLYAQNLSLFAKLFLDTKSVFFDVSTFLYYTLIVRRLPSDEHGQVVGFFSKEKMSWDNNNLACILVFPPWQRMGLGQILIATSYELGRREGRFGGPERPLSALGRKGYISYWCGEICRFLMSAPKKATTVQEISEGTYVLKEDLVAALKEMDVLESRKGAGGVVISKRRVRQWADAHGVSREPVINVDSFLEEEGSDAADEVSEDAEEGAEDSDDMAE